MRKKSLVLLSSGLDSSANLALGVEHDEVALALTANYGQKAAAREIDSARRIAAYYGVKHEVVDLTWLGRLGGSSLTETGMAVPMLQSDQLDEMSVITKSAKSVWVPNRNGVLINVAAAYAERSGAERVLVGFNREEAATFPDNSIAYLNQASLALGFSTANGVKVFSYTAELDKREIVRELRKLTSRAFPFEMVWSCYHGGQSPCGDCESCQRFIRATRAG